MWVVFLILIFAYFIIGLISHVLNIIDYVQRREEKLDEKYPYRKKLQE